MKRSRCLSRRDRLGHGVGRGAVGARLVTGNADADSDIDDGTRAASVVVVNGSGVAVSRWRWSIRAHRGTRSPLMHDCMRASTPTFITLETMDGGVRPANPNRLGFEWRRWQRTGCALR